MAYCGYADSPVDAIRAIEQLAPDLVLLDLKLRNGDGFEVLRSLKETNRGVKVIVVSHRDETIYSERAFRAGARGYVLKDEASDTMLFAIETVLAGGLHSCHATRHQPLDTPDAASGAAERLRGLFNRELEVLHLLGEGRTTKEIAQAMHISPKTVESYRESLKKKLRLPDSLALVRFATLWEQGGNLGTLKGR